MRNFTLFVGFVGHINELGTERFNLLFHGGPNVTGFNHPTKPLGSGNGLKAGNSRTKNHHPSGLHSTGCGHEHGEDSWVGVRRKHNGLVARQVRLRRQDIQRLRARCSGGSFHGKGGEAGGGELFKARAIERREHANKHGALFHTL